MCPSCSPVFRTHGECCCPHEHPSETDPPAADRTPFACAPCCPTRCLTCDATSDTVPRAASPTCTLGATAPEAEPHHPHSEAQGPGPCGDPAGARIQVLPCLGGVKPWDWQVPPCPRVEVPPQAVVVLLLWDREEPKGNSGGRNSCHENGFRTKLWRRVCVPLLGL